METEYKTLRELDVKPGDVVRCMYFDRDSGTYTKTIESVEENIVTYVGGGPDSLVSTCRIISRAPRDETPKLWRDMTDAEKGALLLAHHEGKVIECWGGSNWIGKSHGGWGNCNAYRIRPEPKVETVKLAVYVASEHDYRDIGTINLIDGKHDPASIKMEEL